MINGEKCGMDGRSKLERYNNIEPLLQKVVGLTNIDYLNVYNFYKYTSGEYHKWARHGEGIAISHFQNCEDEFSQMNWVMGQVKVIDLYPLTLCIGPPWIIKLACQNQKCPNYNLLVCEECQDPIESSTPTLGKMVTTINNLNPLDTIYANSRLQQKFRSIQENIRNKSCLPSVIALDYSPPYVFDGNNRLIALAIMEEMKNLYIDCYIGIKK